MKIEKKFIGLTCNGKWVYGNLIQGKNGTCYICSINENPIYKNGDFWYIDSPCYKVIHESIGQFTGLIDKNGKDIYEGYILKNSEGKIGVVEFFNGSFCLKSNGYYVLNSGFLKNKEIIGNIYENHELL